MIYIMVLSLRLCDDGGVCRDVDLFDTPVSTLTACDRLRKGEEERLKQYHPKTRCEIVDLDKLFKEVK